jgi:hypothetical protein
MSDQALPELSDCHAHCTVSFFFGDFTGKGLRREALPFRILCPNV